jgi:hypothetical protein
VLGTGVITVDPHLVALAIASVRERIRVGAGDRPVELIAVTKGFGVDAIEAAVASGCVSIGENYAQELRDKMTALPDGIERPQVHFIGHLQTNKVRVISGHVTVWQSVDRRPLADEIARRSPGASVFVQVNTTSEASKGGCNQGETAALVSYCRSLELSTLGLMTIGPTSGDTTLTRDAFAWLRHSADELGLASCSMGMSNDLEIALEQGATHVRIGSALFGERPRLRAQMK